MGSSTESPPPHARRFLLTLGERLASEDPEPLLQLTPTPAAPLGLLLSPPGLGLAESS